MTTERIATLVLSALVFFAAPALASAQREPVEHAAAHVSLSGEVSPSHAAPHLDTDDRLRAPSAGDYALPVGGIVTGALVAAAGIGAVLYGCLMAIGESFADRDHDASNLVIGIGGAGIGVGAVLVIVSAVTFTQLRHQARDAQSTPNLEGLAVAPVDGGAVATAWGHF